MNSTVSHFKNGRTIDIEDQSEKFKEPKLKYRPITAQVKKVQQMKKNRSLSASTFKNIFQKSDNQSGGFIQLDSIYNIDDCYSLEEETEHTS